MYNRYIPQSDGSYQRNRMYDPSGKQNRTQEQIKCQKPGPPESPLPCNPAKQPKTTPRKQNQSTEGFLKQLLPKGLDTGDLLVILLLLLMAGDCQEEKNTALLTLALYLFL